MLSAMIASGQKIVLSISQTWLVLVNGLTSDVAVIAIVPILPALYSLFFILSSTGVFAAILLGISGDSAQRRMVRRFLWKQRFSLLILFGLCGLCWYGIQQAIAHWTAPTVAPVPVVAGPDWPMFRGGSDRTGVVHGNNGLSRGERLWSRGYQDRFLSSPAVVGNRIFCIGSRNDEGRIFCWNDVTGDLQWVSQPESMRATFSSPVIVGNLLLCGEGLHRTRNARVFCLDISEPADPVLKWSFATNSHVECTPVVIDNRVYIAAGDDGVYALSLTEVQDQRPTVLWHVSGKDLPDVETALIADRDHVYVGLGHGGHALVMLDADTGRELKRFPFDYPVFAPPALVENRLYLGMGHGDHVDPVQSGGGAVVCIDLQDRSVRWTFPTSATVLGAISVSEGEVIFGCADGSVRALSQEGELKSVWESGSPITASLAVTPHVVCGVNSQGRLFVLDRPNLQLNWEVPLGSEGHFISSPTISRGQIYLGTEQYGFQCLGSHAGATGD